MSSANSEGFVPRSISSLLGALLVIAFGNLPAEQSDEPVATTRLFWGDTHVHTSFSPDASLNGNVRIGPGESFRFARGETITGHNGQAARLKRPLDFLVVSDHAEYLGLLPRIRGRDPALDKNPVTRRWGEMIASGDEDEGWEALFEVLHDIQVNQPSFVDEDMSRSVWNSVTAAADQYNQPGKFTAFIGYEWTAMPDGNNLHRVVVFKDGAEKANQVLPFSSFDSDRPEDLWAYFEAYEKRTGGEIMGIPHNGNMSNGLMFQATDSDGKPMDRGHAQSRIRWEPLVEVTQIKGDGETHPFLSPEDEFADFENWDKGNLTATAAHEDWMFRFEYARPALKLGLQIGARTGVNPYRFGMIGSTDSHTGLATAAEDNFWGKFTVYEPGEHRLTHQPVVKGKLGKAYDLWAYEMVASGYAAVWARENTREALFDAMKRKETYATTGSRITARIFAGWDFDEEDAQSARFAEIGYAGGVPMGGELDGTGQSSSPGFMIRASQDPDGVRLERVQMIKGWLDENGASHEAVFDIAVVESGASTFSLYWQDPEFNPQQPAFYYTRVLEVPRPRWSTVEAMQYGVSPPSGVPETIQDRAYTSPIWYVPPDPMKSAAEVRQ